MNKIFAIIFCLNALTAFGQTNSEYYKFSKQILSQIDNDTTAWKYQSGATKLSFSGYYTDVLRIWDKNGFREQKATAEDSLFFINCKKVNAMDYIIEQSKNSQILIINEAHHIPKHRVFTKSLLQGLYENGYRYLGLEALFDTTINERKFPVIESGYYTKEPEFGNLIYEALKIGFTLFGYESSMGKNGKEREIEQAENIQKFIESAQDGKVLIHCGYAHAFENEYPSWGKAMAGRLKEKMGIDPLTIDQTLFLESFDTENNHLFIRLNKAKVPVVLIDNDGQVYNGKNENRQTDIVVVHPRTEYIKNRPDWLLNGKESYTIPLQKIKNDDTILVLAYRKNEFEKNGIPADIVEITGTKSLKELFLAKGFYTIVMNDNEYNIFDKYDVEIK